MKSGEISCDYDRLNLLQALTLSAHLKGQYRETMYVHINWHRSEKCVAIASVREVRKPV